MEYLAKLCVGVVVGLLVYFLFPRDSRARPLTAAVFGVLGAGVGMILSEQIRAFGGSELNVRSLATTAGGALAFSLAYLGMSS